MQLPLIRSAKDLSNLVEELGFLPFFQNPIEGFSIEECTPRELWFSNEADGPWEWKGPVAAGKTCLYGKLFWGRAGFVSRRWFGDFANYRRDGYDFDARFDDELASAKDKYVYDTLAKNESLLSKELKALCNYRKGGNKGFETVITRLQMQTYVTIADFEYMKDKHGNAYGWGVARYSTPEAIVGSEEIAEGYRRDPAESKERIYAYLCKLLPHASEKQLLGLIH